MATQRAHEERRSTALEPGDENHLLLKHMATTSPIYPMVIRDLTRERKHVSHNRYYDTTEIQRSRRALLSARRRRRARREIHCRHSCPATHSIQRHRLARWRDRQREP